MMLGARNTVCGGGASGGIRHLRFRVDATDAGTGKAFFQLSRLVLLDGGGNEYPWPLESMTVTTAFPEDEGAVPETEDIQHRRYGESGWNAFDGSVYTKCCRYGPLPFTLTVDLGAGASLDLKAWRRWQWWSANDSVQHRRNATAFSLAASRNGADWKAVDEVSGYGGPDGGWRNYALGYEGTIKEVA